MAIIPPKEYVEWATHSQAEKTDPGSPLTADGWVDGDAPASSHFNHVFHAIMGYSCFPARTLQAVSAFQNVEFTDPHTDETRPFHNLYTPDVLHVQFINGRWYAIRLESTGNVNVYDSTTGEPDDWNVELDVANSATVSSLSTMVVSRAQAAFAINDSIYYSTDNTLENFQGLSNVWQPAQIDRIYGFKYSRFSNKWVIAGGDVGLTRRIVVADNIGDNGVLVDSTITTDYYSSLAFDPTGQYGIAPHFGNGFSVTSDGGLTWTTTGVTSAPIRHVEYSEALGQFFGVDNIANLVRFPLGSTSGIVTGININNLWFSPTFVGRLSSTDNTIDMFVPNQSDAAYDVYRGVNYGGTTNLFAPNGVWVGSPQKLIYPWGTGSGQATAYYGGVEDGD